jgi:hypothetical protein
MSSSFAQKKRNDIKDASRMFASKNVSNFKAIAALSKENNADGMSEKAKGDAYAALKKRHEARQRDQNNGGISKKKRKKKRAKKTKKWFSYF